MNTKQKITLALTGVICVVPLLGGCSAAQGPVQSKEFSIADVSSIKVDYDGESVEVKESDSDQIIVVEHMNKSRKSYFAKMELSGGSLTIHEGARPIGNGVLSRIEIFLPETYPGSLSLHTTDGRIASSLSMKLSSFQACTTNGTIELSNLSADDIRLTSTGGELRLKNLVTQACMIHTTNADICLENIAGAVTYESKGGNLTMTGASGSGNFRTTGDGEMELAFTEVSGDLTAYTKNGRIYLTLPDKLSFVFSAVTKNGSIQTSFSESLSFAEGTAEGTIGSHADFRIRLETRNGDIAVNA